jgi:uncharacterized membrane protein
MRTDPAQSGAPEAQIAAGHSHDHSAPPASLRTRQVVMAILVPAILATLVGLVALWPGEVDKRESGPGQDRVYGEVTKVVEEPCPEGDPGLEDTPAEQRRCGTATIHITEGTGSGQTVTVELPAGIGAPTLHAGDDAVLLHLEDASAGENPYTVIDHQRGQPLLWMLALAAAVIIAFGRWRGLSAIAGLAVSFAVLLVFVIPAILTGESPLLVAVVGAATIMFAVLYLTHGVNVHTSVAILGTLASLLLTGLLGAGFTAFTELTGIGDEQSAFFAAFQGNVDMRGLLLAGIIIGSLGVLDDVTVTQAMTVAELSRSGDLSRWELYRAATRVGRAHVASAVNTIVLAYAGASLPLLLLLTGSDQPVGELLTGPFLAPELVRSAVGTIGLVASVPITTALAALVADRDGLSSRRTILARRREA